MKCNWNQYNKKLVNRGNINFCFSEDSIKKWRASPCKRIGRPAIFSNDAIITLLILRSVFYLPFRQLGGFAQSLVQNLQLSLPVPHFTCIGKRMKNLSLPKELQSKKHVTDVVFDTSGIRVYESGEWKKDKYGSKRKWKKIHLGIDQATKQIIFVKTTEKYTHDVTHLEDVLRHANGRRGQVLIDGIADIHKAYRLCEKYGKKLLTPPRKTASRFSGCIQRQMHIKLIELLGGDVEAQKIWAKITGYNQRAHVENTFSRWKRIFGESLRSKCDAFIEKEVFINPLILNKMLQTG